MSGETQKIFFSYAREDSDFALKLAKALRAAGADLWIDQLDIPAGRRWDRAVEEALEACSRMLVVLSPEAVDSPNVMDEVWRRRGGRGRKDLTGLPLHVAAPSKGTAGGTRKTCQVGLFSMFRPFWFIHISAYRLKIYANNFLKVTQCCHPGWCTLGAGVWKGAMPLHLDGKRVLLTNQGNHGTPTH